MKTLRTSSRDCGRNQRSYELTAAEQSTLPGQVLALLVRGHAEKRRFTGAELAWQLGYHGDRQVRLAINELREKGYVVLLAVRGEMGYWLSDSAQEVNDYIATQQSRIVEDAKLIRTVRDSAARAIQGIAQLKLELGE